MITARKLLKIICPLFTVVFCVLGLNIFLQNSRLVKQSSAAEEWQVETLSKNPDAKSVFPSITYDKNGKTHIIWIEYGEETNPSKLYYTNNINGQFREPFLVDDRVGRNSRPMTSISVVNNNAHVFYTDNNNFAKHAVLILDNVAGVTSGPKTILSPEGAKGYPGNSVVDTSGSIHVTWIDNRSGEYQTYHRIWKEDAWEEKTLEILKNNKYQRDPNLVVTDDGKIHALFRNDSKIGYAVFDAGIWSEKAAPVLDNPNNLSLTTDGKNVYVIASVTEDTHNVYVFRKAEGEATWKEKEKINEGWGDFPHSFYNPDTKKIYAVWSKQQNENTMSLQMREIKKDTGLGEIMNVANGLSSNVKGASASHEISTVWQDKTEGKEEIKFAKKTDGPVTPTTDCQLKIKGDATCNGEIGIEDYGRWRREYIEELNTTTADFDGIGGVAIGDYSVWQFNYSKGISN